MSLYPTSGRAWARVLMLLALLALISGMAWLWRDFSRFGHAPLHVASPNGGVQGYSIDIGRGSSFREIVAELRQRRLTDASFWYWRALAEQLHVAGRLHAGEYALAVGITPRSLLANMAAGKVMQRNFTIVEGWSFQQLKQALAGADKLRHDLQPLDGSAIMQKLGAPGEPPEGRFLPETYAYVKGDGELDILRRAHAAMNKTLATEWKQRDARLTLATPYDALILASIVEKETGRADERARIAGVFVRRLQNHMLLQTDPTVIYGMGASYAGNIHKSDLAVDTPYNSYLRAGLPPTPIAMPGRAALQATLHPAMGNELYFVARGDGTHEFSATLAEHNRHVACYQLRHCQ